MLSESTLVKIPHCWKSHVTAHITSIVHNEHFIHTTQITRGLHHSKQVSVTCMEPLLTLKAPPIICSRRQFQFCCFLKIANKA